MALNEKDLGNKIILQGEKVLALTAGQVVQVTVDGVSQDELEYTVPAGKTTTLIYCANGTTR